MNIGWMRDDINGLLLILWGMIMALQLGFLKCLLNNLQCLLISFRIKSYTSHNGIIKPLQTGSITRHFISYYSSS